MNPAKHIHRKKGTFEAADQVVLAYTIPPFFLLNHQLCLPLELLHPLSQHLLHHAKNNTKDTQHCTGGCA